MYKTAIICNHARTMYTFVFVIFLQNGVHHCLIWYPIKKVFCLYHISQTIELYIVTNNDTKFALTINMHASVLVNKFPNNSQPCILHQFIIFHCCTCKYGRYDVWRIRRWAMSTLIQIMARRRIGDTCKWHTHKKKYYHSSIMIFHPGDCSYFKVISDPHQHLDCLFKCLFRLANSKISQYWPLWGNPPVIPMQRASDAESVSMSWRRQGSRIILKNYIHYETKALMMTLLLA